MEFKEFYRSLEVDTSLADELNFNPYYLKISSGLTDPIIIEGEEYINLASNNYLGLAFDDRVKKAMVEGITKFGASMCGTPIATGYIDIYKTLEEKFSEFINVEDTIIFPSGYQANCALFPVIAKKDDLIIMDHFAHASLIHGIRSTGCKFRPFLHNNMAHLEKLLKSSNKYSNIFVVTESVFSTEGSIAPFDEIVNLCQKYKAIPVIDDSHGIGVIGKTGRGILEEKNIKDYFGIYTTSLGKALAGAGGVISGKKELIRALRYSCSGLIYSTALPPPVIQGLLKVLEILKEESVQILKKMWKYKKLISKTLKEVGFKLAEGSAPITSIIGGDTKTTVEITKALFKGKILTTPFVPPSVPNNSGKIRIIAGANLKKSSIDQALDFFKTELRKQFIK
ncbi:aminotransferase class I/II-fold pyridoxal phosphate-dependent enzyme [Candidatus Dependentiae bacterium]|nr:aminotransferase class I/II-fold pyridoxal phosphate-dependent enzyme [Candidatus Dependentiae bacterium]